MKTITMGFDEYNQDMRSQFNSGFNKAIRIATEILKTGKRMDEIDEFPELIELIEKLQAKVK